MVLDWLVSLLGFETPAKLDLLKRNRPWPQGTVALHNAQGLHNQWILLTQMRAETITKWSFHFNSSQGDMIRYMWPATDCIMLATVEIYKLCVYNVLYTVHVPEIYSMYKMWTEERESGWVTTIPNKKIVKTFFGCYSWWTKKRIKNTLIVLWKVKTNRIQNCKH